MLLVDTNVIVDVLAKDATWFDWSLRQLRLQSQVHALVIGPVVYAELSPSFDSRQRLDDQMGALGLGYREPPRAAWFIAGLAHRQYRRAGGSRHNVLADFFIGAHAAVLGCGILTRDAARYRSYFPAVEVIAPDSGPRASA